MNYFSAFKKMYATDLTVILPPRQIDDGSTISFVFDPCLCVLNKLGDELLDQISADYLHELASANG